MSSGLPENADEAIALGAAYAVGEQPSILANLALANTITNANLSQQNAVSNVQAMNSVTLAIVAKAAELIMTPGAKSDAAPLMQLVEILSKNATGQTAPVTEIVESVARRAGEEAAASGTSEEHGTGPNAETRQPPIDDVLPPGATDSDTENDSDLRRKLEGA